MAARFTALSLNAVRRQILLPSKVKALKTTVQQRTMFDACTETGAISPKPEVTRFVPLTSSVVVTVVFTIFGAYLAQIFASVLEENDIFALDEDDD